MTDPEPAAPASCVASRVFVIRGARTMLDAHLAEIYGISTARLNQAARRSAQRFPEDFRFQLTASEYDTLAVQITTSHHRTRARRRLPFVYTEKGVAMLSSVLRTERAAAVNLAVVDLFVHVRDVLEGDNRIARDLIDRDAEIAVLFERLEDLLRPPHDSRYPVSYAVSAREQQ